MGTISKLQNAITAKEDIKAALTERGRSPSDLISSYGDEIRGIEDNINNGKTVEVVADSQIKIGDTVYTLNCSGKIYGDANGTVLDSNLYTASFSPDGSTLVLGGNFSGYAKIYSVSGTTITYVSDIYADSGTTALSGAVPTSAFSPDGSTLVLGGSFSGYAKVYSVSGTTITYVCDIYADSASTPLNDGVSVLHFSPDGTSLVLGGFFSGYAKVYSVSGTTISFVSNIYSNNGLSSLDGFVLVAAFSPDGATLVLGGNFSGYAKHYSVSGTTITFVSNMYANAGTTALSSYVSAVNFSPDSSSLVLGGEFSGYAKIYSVSGTAIAFVSDIYSDAGTSALSGGMYGASFSPDGTALVLGGNFDGHAKIYSVSGTKVTFVSNIYDASGSTALSGFVQTVAFSPDGFMLILGGRFTDFAAFYTIKTGLAKLSSNIDKIELISDGSSVTYSSAFSPSGKLLVTGHAGYLSISSVSSDGISEINRISIDGDSTQYLYSCAFSPDGSLLVVGLSLRDGSEVCLNAYSVSGTSVRLIGTIFKEELLDPVSNIGDGGIRSISFSPDGSLLAFGGRFTNYAKVYSVVGNDFTFVSNIPSNETGGAISNDVNVVRFSPDGSLVVVGGLSSVGAKEYSVEGNSIIYVSDITSSPIYSAEFFSSGTNLVLCGIDGIQVSDFDYIGYGGAVYTVSGSTISYSYNFGSNVDIYIKCLSFSNDEDIAIYCGTDMGGQAVIAVATINGGWLSFDRYLYNGAESMNPNPNPIPSVLANSSNGVSFSPNGKIAVVNVGESGYSSTYGIPTINVLCGTHANVADGGVIKPESTVTGVGFAKSDIEEDETGIVKLIGSIDLSYQEAEIAEANEKAAAAIAEANESWSGTLTFSGSYASSTYYTASGCSVAVDKQKKMAFITIQGGTSGSYENILFNTSATLPTGVTMLAPQAYTHSSNSTQRYYTCVLTGVTGKINVAVNLDTINSSYDYVRATLTVTYA